MGNKVNLAMQNQYVEFAKKDGEGNDIAEGIKALQQAISGVVAFDGELEIRSVPGPRTKEYIDATKLTKVGVYKIKDSSKIIFVQNMNSPWSVYCFNGAHITFNNYTSPVNDEFELTAFVDSISEVKVLQLQSLDVNNFSLPSADGLYILNVNGTGTNQYPCGLLFVSRKQFVLKQTSVIYINDVGEIYSYAGKGSSYPATVALTKVEFGTKWYLHNVSITEAGSSHPLSMIILTNSSTPLTKIHLRYYNARTGWAAGGSSSNIPYIVLFGSSYNYGSFCEDIGFKQNSFFRPQDNYQGGTNIVCYPADSIDTSTGLMNARTPTKTILDADITITDTVTAL